MTLGQIILKQQRLLALQAVLLSFFISSIMVISAVVYAKTTLYDKHNNAQKIKKIEENKVFEQMYKGSQITRE